MAPTPDPDRDQGVAADADQPDARARRSVRADRRDDQVTAMAARQRPRGPTRRALLGLGAAAVAGAQALSRRARARVAPVARRTLYLQPLGDELPADDVALVKAALEGIIGWEVKVLPVAALPAAAWYAPRRRYRAEKLLDFLDTREPPDCLRILGLTGAD